MLRSLPCLVTLLLSAPVAAETLGVWTFTPPDGYTLADSADGRRGYTKITGKTFCAIGLYVPRVATSDVSADVNKEWADVIAQFSAADVVRAPAKPTKKKLTQYVIGANLSDKNGTYAAQLVVLIGGGTVGSVRLMSNDARTITTCQDATRDVVDSITIESAATVTSKPDDSGTATAASLATAWSASSLSKEPGTGMSNGSIVRQYVFKKDGTYTFRRETWFGHHGPPRWYIVDESGTYKVAGNRLTLTPNAVKGVVKDDKNKVVKTERPAAETTTYAWQFHYSKGLQENQLVLTPEKATSRDGAFDGGSLFPSSYSYSSQSKVEWRYP